MAGRAVEADDFTLPGSALAGVEAGRVAFLIQQQVPMYAEMPLISPGDDLDLVKRRIMAEGQDDFAWSLHFKPPFLAELFYAGFLPICTELCPPPDAVWVLLPKFHRERAVLKLPDNLHIGKKIRKQAKKYRFSVGQDFDAVVAGCIEQHGETWLHPPIRRALAGLNRCPDTKDAWRTSKGGRPPHILSVELWSSSGTLVAGELFACVGAIVTSLTGFFRESGAGSVQLAALGSWLCQKQVVIWDLGMMLEYKANFGSQLLSRKEWTATQQSLRDTLLDDLRTEAIPADELISRFHESQAAGRAPATSTTLPGGAKASGGSNDIGVEV
jgi:Leu/Phe-tRNA-protein transferase